MNDTAKNIDNAFLVVRETYTNLNKLFSALDNECIENGFINIIKDQKPFLRWKSDNEPFGWLINSFVKLYQKKDSQRKNEDSLSNEIRRDNNIYALEFNLESSPVIRIAKFSFSTNSWTKSPTVSEHWVFYWPLKKTNSKEFEFSTDNDLQKSIPKNETIIKKFKKLKNVEYKEILLTEITSKNFTEKIFKVFDEL
jgi:hypothetical protein